MKNGMLRLPLKATELISFEDNDDELFALLRIFGMAPISVVERNAIRNQRKTGLNSTSKTIPAEVRPSSSTDPLGQEKEYSSTQLDHFKRQKVSLGNASYSSERMVTD
ncbi:hypothetical protein TSUD_259620 [Trifolium subterraneum]|uniref:Uncharacterized protein n=1 Tax=Trifolium subterraneum TaxID=3900 RepID=A0A2Z6MNZ4_TRISU|nr:hypothetical protein TSUD_259620 [Trifolium subterraneum]